MNPILVLPSFLYCYSIQHRSTDCLSPFHFMHTTSSQSNHKLFGTIRVLSLGSLSKPKDISFNPISKVGIILIGTIWLGDPSTVAWSQLLTRYLNDRAACWYRWHLVMLFLQNPPQSLPWDLLVAPDPPPAGIPIPYGIIRRHTEWPQKIPTLELRKGQIHARHSLINMHESYIEIPHRWTPLLLL